MNKVLLVGNVQKEKATTFYGFPLENYSSTAKCCPLFFSII
jgi:hypothetical protein